MPMQTSLFYIFILSSSTFFVWLSEKGRTRWDKGILLTIAFLLVLIPSAVRYGIGTDYFSYVHIYNYPESHARIEEGFSFLNVLLRSLNLPPETAIAFYSFIFTSVAFLAYPKKNKWLMHLLFFSSVMLFSYSGIRQGIAVAFMLYAMKEWMEGGLLKPAIIIIIGASIHYSSLIYIPILIFSLVPLSHKFKSYIFPNIALGLALLAYLTPIILETTKTLMTYLDIAYADYFDGKFGKKTNIGTGLGIILYVVFSFSFIYLTPQLIIKNSRNWGLVILTFFYIFSRILSSKIHIFNRLSDILIVAPIFIPYILYSYNRYNHFGIKKTIAFLFTTMIFLVFLKSSLESPSTNGGLGVTPYTSIFNK